MDIRRIYYRIKLALIYDNFCKSYSSCDYCLFDYVCEEMYTNYPEDMYMEIKNSMRRVKKEG